MWVQPRFDNYQFAGRRQKAVSSETGIAFSDYARMHVHRRERTQERRLPTPSWAVNNTELREVILKFVERRFYLTGSRKMSGLTNEQRLARVRNAEMKWADRMGVKLREAIRRYKEEQAAGVDPEKLNNDHYMQIGNLDSQILMARRGNAAIASLVVYLYYRLGWDSVTVAEEIGIKPPHVRQTLARLYNAANNVRYIRPCDREAYEQRKAAREQRKIEREAERQAHAARMAELREYRQARKATIAAERLRGSARRLRHQEICRTVEIFKKLSKIIRYHGNVERLNNKKKLGKWDKDRLLFVHFLVLENVPWPRIASKLGCKTVAGVQQAYRHFMKYGIGAPKNAGKLAA